MSIARRTPWLLLLLAIVGSAPGSSAAQTSEPPAVGSPLPETPTRDVPAPGQPGEGALTRGKIPLSDFLRFIGLRTGRPVVLPSQSKNRPLGETIEIEVLNDIPSFSFEIAEAILAANGFALAKERLADGSNVYKVDAVAGVVRPVGTRLAAFEDRDSREMAVFIRELQHADATATSQIFRDLFSEAGAGKKPETRFFAVGRQLVATAPVGVLRNVAGILPKIDVPVRRQNATLAVITLERADATELVTLLEQLFAGVARAEPGEDLGARFIADPRTQKIIVRTKRPEDLRVARALIALLDVRAASAYGSIRIHLVRYHKASVLAEVLQQWIEGAGFPPEVRAVPHDDSNTIILRGGGERMREIELELEKLDRPTPAGEAGVDGEPLPQVFVVALMHARAPELAKALRERLRSRPVLIVPHRATNSILFSTPVDQREPVEKLVRSLDVP